MRMATFLCCGYNACLLQAADDAKATSMARPSAVVHLRGSGTGISSELADEVRYMQNILQNDERFDLVSLFVSSKQIASLSKLIQQKLTKSYHRVIVVYSGHCDGERIFFGDEDAPMTALELQAVVIHALGSDWHGDCTLVLNCCYAAQFAFSHPTFKDKDAHILSFLAYVRNTIFSMLADHLRIIFGESVGNKLNNVKTPLETNDLDTLRSHCNRELWWTTTSPRQRALAASYLCMHHAAQHEAVLEALDSMADPVVAVFLTRALAAAAGGTRCTGNGKKDPLTAVDSNRDLFTYSHSYVRWQEGQTCIAIWPLSLGPMPAVGFLRQFMQSEDSDSWSEHENLTLLQSVLGEDCFGSGSPMRAPDPADHDAAASGAASEGYRGNSKRSQPAAHCDASAVDAGIASSGAAALLDIPSPPTVHVYKAGNGDSALLVWRDSAILVDGGVIRTSPCFMAHMEQLDKNVKIRAILLTHGDSDHANGLLGLFEKPSKALVRRLHDSECTYIGHGIAVRSQQSFARANDCYHKAKSSTLVKNAVGDLGTTAARSHKIQLADGGSITIDLVWPDDNARERLLKRLAGLEFLTKHNPNAAAKPEGWLDSINVMLEACSIGKFDNAKAAADEGRSMSGGRHGQSAVNIWSSAYRITCEDRTKNSWRLLFTGDTYGPDIVKSLRKESAVLAYRYDYVDVPHHGSIKNHSDDLLTYTKPRHIVISTNGKHHGHPDAKTVAKIVKHLDAEGGCLCLSYAPDEATVKWPEEVSEMVKDKRASQKDDTSTNWTVRVPQDGSHLQVSLGS